MPYLGVQTLKDAEIKRGSATGNGSTTAYAIGWTPPSEQSLFITINGVTQQDAAYTISGATLTFAAAPASADAIEWRGIQSSGTVITPGDGTVGEAKIADDAVVLAKLGTTGTASTSTFLRGDMAWTATGKILQVVSAGTTTHASSSTATYVDTGLTVTITPASTSNKILILGTQADCYKSSANSNNSIHIRLVRDSTEILDVCDRALFTGSALENMQNISFNYLDSPSSTSAITYKTQFHNQGAYAAVTVQQQQAGRSTITVMEVEA